MPVGGTPERPGWYSDWFNFGDHGSPAWETFHIETVLPYVDRTFRTLRDRDSRVVAGPAAQRAVATDPGAYWQRARVRISRVSR